MTPVGNITYSVVRAGMVSDAAEAALQAIHDGEIAVIGADASDRDHYFVRLDRPALTVADLSAPADGASHVIASGLPAGTAVSIDGVPHGAVDDGTLEFDAVRPGTFKVNFTPPFPWKAAAMVLTVTLPDMKAAP